MFSFFKQFFQPSRLLTNRDFEAMCIGASVLEQDVRGIKVWLLSNGRILKIFRLRGFFTSSRLYSNARSFCRNAERLKQLEVFTVGTCALFHLSNSSNTAVIYEPLAGETVKELLRNNGITEKDCIELGAFIANLHNLGMHFKSLHFGNIVRTLSGGFGLIDISDMKIFPWRLMLNTRIRGFERLLRYQEDIQVMGEKKWELVLSSYIENTGLNESQARVLRLKLAC